MFHNAWGDERWKYSPFSDLKILSSLLLLGVDGPHETIIHKNMWYSSDKNFSQAQDHHIASLQQELREKH